jgi:hypothetical protein
MKAFILAASVFSLSEITEPPETDKKPEPPKPVQPADKVCSSCHPPKKTHPTTPGKKKIKIVPTIPLQDLFTK